MSLQAAADDVLSPTLAVAHFVSGFDASQMREVEKVAVVRQTLDTLGVAIAGSQSPIIDKLLSALRPGPGDGLVPALMDSVDRPTAAYLFGTAAHSLEFDDGHRGGSVHPGAVVVPAALSYAVRRDVAGLELLRAIAIGYQVTVALAEELNPRARARGFHNTPVAGVFGATAAVAALMRLGPAEVEHAFGLAGSSAAGVFAFLLGGGDVKRMHAGFAAREGLLAATFAQAGVTGPHSILECHDGFFHAFSGHQPKESFVEAFRLPRPEANLKVVDSYIKPYSCCAHIHPAIDGVLDIMREENVVAGDIARIEAGSYAIAAQHGEAGWETMGEAQLSYPFAVATAALNGMVAPAHFSPEALASPETAALARRISVGVDTEAEAIYPKARAAVVALKLRDGREFVKRVVEPRGSPSKPVDDADLSGKFRTLAGPVIGQASAERVEALVRGLDGLKTLDELVGALRPAS